MSMLKLLSFKRRALLEFIVCCVMLEFAHGDPQAQDKIHEDLMLNLNNECTQVSDVDCQDPRLQKHRNFETLCSTSVDGELYSCSEACRIYPESVTCKQFCSGYQETCMAPDHLNHNQREAVDEESRNTVIIVTTTVVGLLATLVLGYIVFGLFRQNAKGHGELLGKGAFGSVYRHYDQQEKIMIAVKKIYLGSSKSGEISKEVKAARKEVLTMEKFNHERIVKYIRSDETVDTLCIYMEYVPDGSLKNQLDISGCLSEILTKKYTKQILEGLCYLHSCSIIHRDIKCANILCDGKGNIKLADFGLAKFMSYILTLQGQTNTHLQGTAHWMAPEVIKAEKYGRRADIWSTGVAVVEMLTAHPPWHKLEPYQAMYKTGNLEKGGYVLDPTISKDAEEFLEQIFTPEDQRPRAEDLQQHSWLKTL